jgi:hypothetical protein
MLRATWGASGPGDSRGMDPSSEQEHDLNACQAPTLKEGRRPLSAVSEGGLEPPRDCSH